MGFGLNERLAEPYLLELADPPGKPPDMVEIMGEELIWP